MNLAAHTGAFCENEDKLGAQAPGAKLPCSPGGQPGGDEAHTRRTTFARKLGGRRSDSRTLPTLPEVPFGRSPRPGSDSLLAANSCRRPVCCGSPPRPIRGRIPPAGIGISTLVGDAKASAVKSISIRDCSDTSSIRSSGAKARAPALRPSMRTGTGSNSFGTLPDRPAPPRCR